MNMDILKIKMQNMNLLSSAKGHLCGKFQDTLANIILFPSGKFIRMRTQLELSHYHFFLAFGS